MYFDILNHLGMAQKCDRHMDRQTLSDVCLKPQKNTYTHCKANKLALCIHPFSTLGSNNKLFHSRICNIHIGLDWVAISKSLSLAVTVNIKKCTSRMN